nr:reverse transcriptase domain-containing protein [Tanacetum cinerariifolium]
MARMDAMTMKMNAQYKEFQSRWKQQNPDNNDDDIPMSCVEEAIFMQTFCRTHFTMITAILECPTMENFSRNSIDVIYKILESDFDALFDKGSEILHSIKGTILEEKLFAEFDEFMAMTADENSKSKSESDTEEPPF